MIAMASTGDPPSPAVPAKSCGSIVGITVGVAVSIILIILFCRTAQGTDMVGDTLRRQVDYDGIPASSGKEEEGEEEEPTAANTIPLRCIGV